MKYPGTSRFRPTLGHHSAHDWGHWRTAEVPKYNGFSQRHFSTAKQANRWPEGPGTAPQPISSSQCCATPGTSFPPFLVSLACSCPYAEIIAVTWQSKNTPTGPVRVRSHRQVQKVPLLQFTNLQFHFNQVPALSLPASRLLFSHASSLKALALFLGTGSSAASIVAFTRFPPYQHHKQNQSKWPLPPPSRPPAMSVSTASRRRLSASC